MNDWVAGCVVATILHGAFFCSDIFIAQGSAFSVVQAPASIEVSLVALPIAPTETTGGEQCAAKVVVRDRVSVAEPVAKKKIHQEEKRKKAASGMPVAGAITQARPHVRENTAPRYPRLARERGYEGTVVLVVRVSRQGTVAGSVIKKSSGYRVLDRAAEKAVRTWLFAPARRSGVLFESTVEIPIEFRLK